MAKLTKAQSRLHQDACNLLARPLSSPLTSHEKEFILTHWDPSANHINTVAGAFFTPLEMAWDLAHEAGTPHSLVDLCAGIGTLAYCTRNQGFREREHGPTVCVEINPAYVEVGKRILPEALWICADVFKWFTVIGPPPVFWDGQIFDAAISNPPFGFPQNYKSIKSFLPVPGAPLDLNVLAVAGGISRTATFILSQGACPFEYSGRQGYTPRPSNHFDKFSQQTGIQSLECSSVDCSIYKDKWRGVMPNIELVSVDFTSNPEEEDETGGEVTMQGSEEQGQQNEPPSENPERQDPDTGGQGLLSLQQIVDEVGISYVTGVRYAAAGVASDMVVGEGRKRKYKPEAVEEFRKRMVTIAKGRKKLGTGVTEVAAGAREPSRQQQRRPSRPGRKPAGRKATTRSASTPAPAPVPASSASTLAMDQVMRELETAQYVTRLEALKEAIAPAQREIERLEQLIGRSKEGGT